MKKIAENFRGHYKELILGPMFKLLEAVLELLVPLVMASIIDVGIARGDTRYVVTRGLLMLLLGALGVVFAMICQYYAAIVAGQIGQSLRKQTYKHAMALSGADIAPMGAGGLITRLTNDVNQIQTGINMVIRLASRAPFLAIGGIIMALRIDLTIGSIFLVSIPLIVLILYFIMRRTLPSYGKIQSEQDNLSRLSSENLAGVRVIRAFSRQEEEVRGYDAAGNDLTRLTIRVGKLSAALNPLTSVIVNFAIIAIIWLGAGHVFEGRLLTGEVIALVNYMNQTLLALIVAANLVVLFTRALASARRVEAVLEMEPSVAADKDGTLEIPAENTNHPVPTASFHDVNFAYYEGADNVLSHISFSLLPGQTVGMIGGTGSGKSTIANLLMRYYDSDSGEVSFRGVDVRRLDPKALRAQIGLAPQKAVLFAGSIRRNLLIAAPDATDADIWHALEVAQGAEFVRKMPGQLDAMVEEGGKNLSGGQRQRLTIAQALVRNPQLLILDDSASALDYATDAALRRALAQERAANPARTILIISQRAASLKNADHILVLDDGQLAAQGTHEQLLATSSVYQEICHSQGIGTQEGGMQ